ncbi:hypothetical protein GNF76_14440 [Pseudomonas sp. CCM 7893]|uniref:Uncharacterized protein n=1 Tax=Pseudomonas spelaei TaxID=1055469 RepID=A0A6I3W4P1_9PSED|nr:hypothetical protein [Pseudomonas spelaei]MUF05550.1 hypothetical protein [Pseudomonas spelaei]
MSTSSSTSGGTADLASPRLPQEVSNGVTDTFLQENNDRLPVIIARYQDQAVGQLISLSVGGPNAKPIVFYTVPDAASDTTVYVPGAELRALANGIHLLFYTVTTYQEMKSKGAFLRLKLGNGA